MERHAGRRKIVEVCVENDCGEVDEGREKRVERAGRTGIYVAGAAVG